jgi:hypothetical protein
MLRATSEKVHDCHGQAALARQRAELASVEWDRDSWRDLEAGWLLLARSYEFEVKLEMALLILSITMAAVASVIYLTEFIIN